MTVQITSEVHEYKNVAFTLDFRLGDAGWTWTTNVGLRALRSLGPKADLWMARAAAVQQARRSISAQNSMYEHVASDGTRFGYRLEYCKVMPGRLSWTARLYGDSGPVSDAQGLIHMEPGASDRACFLLCCEAVMHHAELLAIRTRKTKLRAAKEEHSVESDRKKPAGSKEPADPSSARTDTEGREQRLVGRMDRCVCQSK